MAGTDLETILKIAESEKVATNATSLTAFLKEADKSLNTFDNIIDHLDKIYGFINKLERSPLVGTLFRQTYGNDKIGPLIKEVGIVPKTHSHEQILNNINQLDENQLKDLMQRLLELDRQRQLKDVGKTADDLLKDNGDIDD